uniref:Uncharacterized protein n=1 Tax=Romanomermis culicivorax TaxID=13658 RepID=A0A915K1H0_ROMCU
FIRLLEGRTSSVSSLGSKCQSAKLAKEIKQEITGAIQRGNILSIAQHIYKRRVRYKNDICSTANRKTAKCRPSMYHQELRYGLPDDNSFQAFQDH